ncbi:MAG: hypothetical protein J6W06_04015, partial [Bacteroidales bacterium]|nr:hypothetical protein [Bacteroidales bacterium]
QQAQQQWQAQMELERVKNADFRMQMAAKDMPLPIQFAMAAKAELIDPQIADYFIRVMIQQIAPQLAQQMQQGGQIYPPQAGQPQQLPEQPIAQPPYNQQQAMTQAAMQSLMNGSAPAI